MIYKQSECEVHWGVLTTHLLELESVEDDLELKVLLLDTEEDE